MATVSQELQIKISASTSKLGNALNKAKTKVKNFAKKAKKALKIVSVAFIALGVSAFFLGKKLVGMAMKFETSMAQVATLITDSTEKQIKNLSERVIKLSSKFGMATSAMTKGLYDLISAGVDAKDSINALEVATKSAMAGNTDTATSVDALTSIVNAYGDALGKNLSYTKKMEKASDYLFTVIKYGKTTYAELAQSIGEVTSIAASAEVNLRELGAMIAVLTKVGVKTPAAITSIKAVLTALMKPQSTAIKAAKKMGFEFSMQALKAKGLYGFLMNLTKKMNVHNNAVKKGIKVGKEYNTATLFGNVRALKAVIVAVGKAKGEYQSLYGKMANVSGETEKAFSKMEATSAFKINRMIQTLSNFGLQVGLEVLKPLAKWIESTKKARDSWLKYFKDINIGKKIIETLIKTWTYLSKAIDFTITSLKKIKEVYTKYIQPAFTYIKKGLVGLYYAFQMLTYDIIGEFMLMGSKIKNIWNVITHFFKIGWLAMTLEAKKGVLVLIRTLEEAFAYVPGYEKVATTLEMSGTKLAGNINKQKQEMKKLKTEYVGTTKEVLKQREIMSKHIVMKKRESLIAMELALLGKKTTEEGKKASKQAVIIMKEAKITAPSKKAVPKISKKLSWDEKLWELQQKKISQTKIKMKKKEPNLSEWKEKVGWKQPQVSYSPASKLETWKQKVGFQEPKKDYFSVYKEQQTKQNIQQDKTQQNKKGQTIIINAIASNPTAVAKKVKKILEKQEKRKISVGAEE